jgi:hypothetical protein
MFEDKVIAISFGNFFHNNRIRTRTGCRRKLKIKHGSIYFIHFQPVYLFQLFDTRLYLYGFSCLVPESFDKGFGILKLFLLILESTKLLFASFLPQGYILRIVYFVIVYLSKRDFYRSESCGINKGPVVRNKNNCIRPCGQKVSSHCIDSISRWLVGSSSNSTSG